jgi:hypothetical protein
MVLSTDILQPKKRKNKRCTKIKALSHPKKAGQFPMHRLLRRKKGAGDAF